jgi:predicted HTH transcriptional regulator
MKYPKSLLRTFFKKITEKNPTLFKTTDVLNEEIFELLKKGENDKIEFKSTFRTNLHTNEIDRKIEHSALKTIAAFINSKGGILLIGVNDSKEIIGIEKDSFTNLDKFSLHLTNLIKTRLGKNSFNFVKHKFIDVNGKIVLKIECEKGDKPIFLKYQDSEEEFYIRTGPSSTQINGSELVEYIGKNFKNKN